MVMEADAKIMLPHKWSPEEQAEMLWLTEVLEGPIGMAGVMGIVGLPRSGKSLFMIWMSYKMRKYFGMPIVADFHFKPNFGPYTYIDDDKFNEEQVNMIKIAKKRGLKDKENEVLDKMWTDAGVSYYKSVVCWDEAYQKMDVRRWLDPVSIRYSYVIFQYGHYQCLLLIATPTNDMMDSKRYKKFVTHEVGCSFHANWMNTGAKVCSYTIYNRNTMKRYSLNIPVEKWAVMYDTSVLIAPRMGTLGLKANKINKGG